MMKSKKLLSALLTFLMVFSLVVIPQSALAAATNTVYFNMDSKPTSGIYGNTQAADYGITGIYGNSTSVLRLAATSSAQNYYLGINPSMPLGADTRTILSYDIAFDEFAELSSYGAGNCNHYSLLTLTNGSSTLKTINLLQVNNGAFVSVDNAISGTSFGVKKWHNVSAVLDIGSAGTTWTIQVYIDGVLISTPNNSTGTTSSAITNIGYVRLRDDSEDKGNVYIDNFLCETYPSTDNVSVSFSAASTKTDASLVDTTNKKITLSANNIAMTVEAFNAIDDGFVFLKNDGTTAESTDKIADCNAYSVMANDTNSYYVPYAVEYPTPIIAGTSDRTKAIIDSDAKTISLVDNQYLTVGEFKAETTGAKVMNGDDEAADDELLSGCTVYATIDGYAELDQEYTFVYGRDYYIDESFDGTINTTDNGGGRNLYTTSSGVKVLSYGNGIKGVTFGEYTYGDNKAIAMYGSEVTATNEAFFYIPDGYISSNTVTKTHTIEFKIMSTALNDIKLIAGKVRYPFTMLSNGTIKVTGETKSAGTWTTNDWINVAITYYKGSNRMEVYVNGTLVENDWIAGVPTEAALRIQGFFKTNATNMIAIDDLKIYTGGLEEYKLAYYKDGVETTDIASANTVKVVASDSFNYVPVLAKYQAGELVAISVGTNKTAEMTIGDASEVKFFYWNSVTGATPFEKSKTVYASDGVNPVTAYNATLSNAFGNGMVLQRGEEIKVWGTANDANYSALTVALGDEKKTAYVMDGEWEVSFDARSANSDGIDLTVTTLSSTTKINDILIGDVYVIGGQSNAALPLSVTSEYLKHQNNEMRSFDGNVRMLYQPRNSDACTTPRKTLIDGCEWGIVEFDTGSAYAATVLPRYSALGIYFGEYLADGLEAANIDVPIGVIEATLGGTSLFEHVNEEIFNKYNPTYLATANKASRIYNKNIAPFEKFAVNGVIWYQGENESIGSIIDESTKIYADMFADYLGQYRQTDNFNAFVVQLSSHTTNAHSDGTAGWNVPRMRAYQYDMAKNGGYYIIPSLDYGVKTEEYDAATDKSDIAAHPKYKKPIGERAANAVLAVIYGQDAAMAPVYDTITYAEDKVTITFKNAGTGLSLANGESLLGFELIKDGVATAANATITGTNTVELTGVTGATGVRYAFYRSAPKTIANLANSYGVACPTFVHSNDGNDSGKINPISLGAME